MLREAIKSQISCVRPKWPLNNGENSKLLQGIRGTLFSDKPLCLKHVGHTGFHIFNISICTYYIHVYICVYVYIYMYIYIYIHTYDGFYHSNSNKYKCPLCSPNLFCLSSLCSLFATVTSQQPIDLQKSHRIPHWGLQFQWTKWIWLYLTR